MYVLIVWTLQLRPPYQSVQQLLAELTFRYKEGSVQGQRIFQVLIDCTSITAGLGDCLLTVMFKCVSMPGRQSFYRWRIKIFPSVFACWSNWCFWHDLLEQLVLNHLTVALLFLTGAKLSYF